MSKSQSDKINQMVQFILREAEDKVNEIETLTNEEISKEKDAKIKDAKAQIKENYKRKEKQFEIERKMYAQKIL